MTDYMDTPQEQAKQPTAKPLFEKIANGNRDVYCALWSFWNFAHAWDDLLDGSNWPAPQKERAMKALHDFIVNLLLNPFCRDNAGDLRAVFVSAMARSMDGDAMAESNDPKRRALAPAVRCGDVDVILHMAYLAGGWELLREIGPLRDYDPEDPKPKD